MEWVLGRKNRGATPRKGRQLMNVQRLIESGCGLD